MPLPSSPLVLLFAFSSVCLLLGALLLTGGDVTSVLFSAAASSPRAASSTRHLAVSSPSSSSQSSSPLTSVSLLHAYQSSWSTLSLLPSSSFSANSTLLSTVPSSSSSSSSCYASFPVSSSVVYVSSNVDDPSLNAALPSDSGHQLLQWLAGVHVALTLRLAFLNSNIFPSRPHWDAFVGLGSGEKRVALLQMELGGYQQQHVGQKTVAQLTDGLLEVQQVKQALNDNSPLVVELGETQVRAVEEDTAWLNDTRLLATVRRKYCTARLYRPVAVDLFAPHRAAHPASVVETAAAAVAVTDTSASGSSDSSRGQQPLYLPAAFILAVHVEYDKACSESGSEQDSYVQQLAVNVTAVLRAIGQLYAAAASDQLSSLTGTVRSAAAASSASLPPSAVPSSLHVFIHLFADRSALEGTSDSNEASIEATLSLASQLRAAQQPTSSSSAQQSSSQHQLPHHSVYSHLRILSTWAMHHYATADAFVGNLKGSLHNTTQHTHAVIHYGLLAHVHHLRCPLCSSAPSAHLTAPVLLFVC